MHSTFLGVVKSFFKYWFTNKNEPYLLWLWRDEINKRLLNIRPPSFINQAPRPIDQFNFSESLRVPLLYFILFSSRVLLIDAKSLFRKPIVSSYFTKIFILICDRKKASRSNREPFNQICF